MYFLSGEHRIYDYQKGLVGRVIPRSKRFTSATRKSDLRSAPWQVGARWNYLNLNDKGVNGGALNAMTFAVNWFLNPNMKIQANYDVTFPGCECGHEQSLGGWHGGNHLRFRDASGRGFLRPTEHDVEYLALPH